jgi:hypothetical protein
LTFHFGELIVCERCRELSGKTQPSNHGATSNVEMIRIAIELDG